MLPSFSVILLIFTFFFSTSSFYLPPSSPFSSTSHCSTTLFTSPNSPDSISPLESLKAEESRLLDLLSTVRAQKLANLQSKPLRIAVVGFGRFGQFIAKTFSKYAEVIGVSRSDYSKEAKEMGVDFVPLSDFPSQFASGAIQIDVVVLATSILSFERLVSTITSSLNSLDSQSSPLASDYPLIVDVLSVKEHPRRVMLNSLPDQCDILCSHPMFGE